MSRIAVHIVVALAIVSTPVVAVAQTAAPSASKPMPGPLPPAEPGAGKSTAAERAGMDTTDPNAGGVAGTGMGGKTSDPIKGVDGTGQSVSGPAGSALSKGMTSSPGGGGLGGAQVGDKQLPPPKP